MEPADEEADGEQPEPGMAAGFDNGLGQRLLLCCRRTFIRIAGEHTSQNNAQGGEDGQHQNRLNPTHRGDQRLADRDQGEHADRAADGGDAERQGAPILRDEPAYGTQHNGKCRPAETKPNEKPDAEVEGGRIAGDRRQRKSGGVKQPTDGDDPAGAVFIGDRARKGLGDAPDNALNSEGEAKDGSAQFEVRTYRRYEESEALPDPHTDTKNKGRARDRDQRLRSERRRGGLRNACIRHHPAPARSK